MADHCFGTDPRKLANIGGVSYFGMVANITRTDKVCARLNVRSLFNDDWSGGFVDCCSTKGWVLGRGSERGDKFSQLRL